MPASSPKIELTSQITLALTTSTLATHLALSLDGNEYTSEDIFNIVVSACAEKTTIEQACQKHPSAPHPNNVRYHLNDKLLFDIDQLEDDLNATLSTHLPPSLSKKARKVAADLTFIPYHGSPKESDFEVCRSKAKDGTTHFHCYASAYVMKKNQRYTLALTFVRANDTLPLVIDRLRKRIASAGVPLKELYLDKQFYTVEVINNLKQQRIPFVMPVVHRGRSGGSRKLLSGRKSHKTQYTMSSPKYGKATFEVWVVRKYSKGKYGRHGVEWFAYAVSGVKCALGQIYEEYRKRFGIESSYRLMNQARARTSSQDPALRLLFVGVAFLLLNLWVYLKWYYVSVHSQGGRKILNKLFPFERVLLFISEAVKEIYGIVTQIRVS